MSGFAPAYQHESNTAWLNQIVGDIIDPNNRADCRNYGRDWDDDMVDDPEHESDNQDAREELEKLSDGTVNHKRSTSLASTARADQATPVPSRVSSVRATRARSRSNQVPGSPGLSAYHAVTRGWRRDRRPNRTPTPSLEDEASPSGTRQTADGSSQVLASPMSAFISSDRHGRSVSRTGTRRLEDGRSTQLVSPLSLGGFSHDSQLEEFPPHTSRPVVSPISVPRTPAPPYEETEAKVSRPPPAKSLYRSFSSQGWSYADRKTKTDLHRQPSILSNISEFSGFAPHPGVRPLEHRSVLGEAAGPSDDDPTQYPSALPLTLILIGICLSVFIISLDRNIITTAIPQITARFHSYDDIGWYGSAYLLTASAFQPLYGRIYMSFETKSSFLNALAVFEIGSLICALSPSSIVLIIGRAIQGLGSAGILTGSFVVATHSVHLRHRPVTFACVGILYAVGALCGPLLGGAFTDTIGWRWCFWLNLPIGAVTFGTVFICFTHRQPASKDKDEKTGQPKLRQPFLTRVLALDITGNLILLSAATMLFLALQFSETRYTWSSARCIGLITGFGITTLVFLVWIWYKGDSALLPPRIILQRTVAASCGTAFLLYGAVLIHSYYLPIWFQAIKGSSAINSGVNMIPYMAANALFSLLAGIFVSKNGLFAPPAIIGCAIGTIGCGMLATLKPTTSTAMWVGFEILASAGIGMAIQQGFSAVQTALPLEEVPIGTAAVVASQSFGGAIFISVGNTLLQNHLLNKQNDSSLAGVNVRAVIEMGATNFRKFVPEGQLGELVRLYNESLQGVFVAAVPLMGVAFLCACCMEWRSVRRGESAGMAKKKDEEGKGEKV